MMFLKLTIHVTFGAMLAGANIVAFGAGSPPPPSITPAPNISTQQFESQAAAEDGFVAAFSTALSRQDLAGLDVAMQGLLASTKLTPHERFNVLWKAYGQHRMHPVAGQYLLDAMQHTADISGIDRLIEEFNSPTTPTDIKARIVNVVRELHSQFKRDVKSPVDESTVTTTVRSFFEAAAGHEDSNIAGTASIALSRFEASPKTKAVVRSAFERGDLDAETYTRELLMQLPSYADAQEQNAIADQLRQTVMQSPNTKFVQDAATMIAALYNEQTISRFSPEVRHNLDAILTAGEPTVSLTNERLSVIESVRYGQWVAAKARYAGVSERGMPAYLMKEMLSSQSSDAKILAILQSPYAGRILVQANEEDKQRLADRLENAEVNRSSLTDTLRSRAIKALSHRSVNPANDGASSPPDSDTRFPGSGD
ncbi:MAG: hypothetical protein AB7E55_15890 [Pigmentiphaga sp.]